MSLCCVIMLSVVFDFCYLNAIMVSVIILNVVMLSVIMLSAIMLNVTAPLAAKETP